MPMDIDLSEYLEDYLVEFEEHLNELNHGLLELEKNPNNPKVINEIFRYIHTIKGNAGTMGFTDINKVGHVLEDLLGELRAERLTLNPAMMEVLFKGYDAIVELKAAIGGSPHSVDVEGLVARVKPHLKPQAAAPPPPPPAPPPPPPVAAKAPTPPPAPAAPAAPQVRRPPQAGGEPPSQHEITYYILLEFDPAMVMRAVRAFLVLNKLKDLGQVTESMPTGREIEADAPFDVLLIKFDSKAPQARIKSILSFGEAREIRLEPLDAVRAREPLSVLAAQMHGGGAAPAPAAPAPAPAAPPPAPPAPPRAATPNVLEGVDLAEVLGSAGMTRAATVPPPGPAAPQGAAARAVAAPPPPAISFTAEQWVDRLSEDHKAAIAEAMQAAQNVFVVDVHFKDKTDAARMRAGAILIALADLGMLIAVTPAKDELSGSGFHGRLTMLLASEREAIQVRRLLVAPEVLRASADNLQLDGAKIVVASGDTPARSAGPSPAAARQGDDKRANVAQTVRVGVDRLDALMNLVGELVISRTQFVQLLTHYNEHGNVEDLNTAITMLNQNLTRITNALQAGIMKVRMVQIGQVFYRFSRLVRDLSKSLGKQVEFIMEGTETELDKTVIDEIGDPLMHLIRNALDHGIESPDTRRALGKSEKGILMLRAQQVGDHIIVEVVDDGGGLDLERIKQRALERNLIDPGTLKTMGPSDIYNFIFLPGFSTAEKVSTVSGRGVGMDVVKDAIENLAGDIQIKSEPHMGTTVQIKLPLTLAIIQGLLVRVGRESFAIPLSTVKETILLEESMLHVINNNKAVMFREEIIPLIYLDQWFNLGGSESKKNFIVFAGDDDNKIGLVVNSLIGRREIVIKSLDKRYVDVKGFAGATILGDGTVSLILDVPALVEDARGFFVS